MEITLNLPPQFERQIFNIVENAVYRALNAKPQPQEKPDRCDFKEALTFLNEQGYSISESQLYKKTATKDVPFKNFGRKLIFSRRDLLAWMESETVDHDEAATAAALTLARSARRKRNV